MELLVAVIESQDHMQLILDRFYEESINGATVIDSTGMGHLLADHISIFSRFAEIAGDNMGHNKTLFTVVDCEKKLQLAINIIEEVTGGLEQSDTGMLFTLPVNFARGIGSC